MPMGMSKIARCDATDCSYNMNSKCHTMAITVGNSECAFCDTYTKISEKGGAGDVIGGVGACRESDCKHNKSLECNAGSIDVGLHAGHADCVTYKKK